MTKLSFPMIKPTKVWEQYIENNNADLKMKTNTTQYKKINIISDGVW